MIFINIIIWGHHQSHSHPFQELPKHWKASFFFLGGGRGSTITFWCCNTYMLSNSRNAPPRWSWHIFVGCSLWSGCNRHVRPLQAISVAATSPSCQPRPSKIVTFYRPTTRLNCPSPFSVIMTLHLSYACFPYLGRCLILWLSCQTGWLCVGGQFVSVSKHFEITECLGSSFVVVVVLVVVLR